MAMILVECTNDLFFIILIVPLGLSFGLELDSPVVFLSAVVEQSSLPFLPLYNITVSSGTNPRY